MCTPAIQQEHPIVYVDLTSGYITVKSLYDCKKIVNFEES